MTRQERRLWYCFLNSYSVRVYRQKAIGNYIADFYCSKARLVIEIDGSQHFEAKGIAYDQNRTIELSKLGIMVLRFTNPDIDKNFESVCMEIDRVIKERIGAS